MIAHVYIPLAHLKFHLKGVSGFTCIKSLSQIIDNYHQINASSLISKVIMLIELLLRKFGSFQYYINYKFKAISLQLIMVKSVRVLV